MNDLEKAKDCPRFEDCGAPLCPLDTDHGIWYPDEDICGLQKFGSLNWIRNQRKAAKRSKQFDTYYTLAMLEHPCQIKGGITGLDPDKPIETREADIKKWLQNHPPKRQLSDEEKRIRKERMLSLHASNKL